MGGGGVRDDFLLHNPIITTVIKNSHSVSLMKRCVHSYSQKALLELNSLCPNSFFSMNLFYGINSERKFFFQTIIPQLVKVLTRNT